jgi:hypothetical protein
MESSPIADKTQKCVRLLEIYNGVSWASKFHNITWEEDVQIRVNLFTSKLGVFATGSHSIDHRLRKNKTVSRAIVQLLESLLANLTSCMASYPL